MPHYEKLSLELKAPLHVRSSFSAHTETAGLAFGRTHAYLYQTSDAYKKTLEVQHVNAMQGFAAPQDAVAIAWTNSVHFSTLPDHASIRKIIK